MQGSVNPQSSPVDTSPSARWVQGGYAQQYDWEQCKYCGRAQRGDCQPVDCMACGSRQCHGNGSGNGSCRVCYWGYLPGWSRSVDEETCGYTGCHAPAVARAPRVRRVCKKHLLRARAGHASTLADRVAARIAERDSGIGRYPTPGWRWVE